MTSSNYYKKVGAYYDEDAPQFENRYWANKTLQQIRTSFRRETERYTFENALEIGFGPGVDLIYFAIKYPEREIYGIDISKKMTLHAQKQVDDRQLSNIKIEQGSVEDIDSLFPGIKFDLVYVYFGALNTVEDLSIAAECIKKSLKPTGKLVLTVINKWYWMGMLLPLIKLRYRAAFKRAQKTWGGYSPKRELESKCYSPSGIQKAFKGFDLVKKRGYSISFPAWYQDSIRKKLGSFAEFLWKFDKLLNKTPFWSAGEYTLFVFSKK